MSRKISQVASAGPEILFVQSVNGVISNTNSELTIIGTGNGSLTLPANKLVVGSGIRFVICGYFNITGSPTLTLRTKLGAITISTDAIGMASTTNRGFGIDWLMTCKTVGAAGTIGSQAYFRAASGNLFDLETSADTTIDTTASQIINLTGQFSVANAGSNINTQICFVEFLKKVA